MRGHVGPMWLTSMVPVGRELCRELGPSSLRLVDAFGIPDHLVAAPIASDWAEYNKTDNRGELLGDFW
jgi:acyl-CoA oxidase